MNKFSALKRLAIAVCLGMLSWNMLMTAVHPGPRSLTQLRDALIAGCLMWFVADIFDPNVNDDDWAGQV